MIFYSEPNMLVRVRNNTCSRRIKMFRFDSEGKYETEDKRLIEALKRRFKYDVEDTECKEDVDAKELKLKHCKQCDFTSYNQGELLKHYRNSHQKKV